tara:strand:+ start:27292 stop:28419 length:1128 start_codon:yes stop_codon:yes gene_type:complete
MRILIIPDSFKENLSSTEVAKAIKKGIVNVLPEANIKEIPFSDGGEGALTVLQKYSAGRIVKCKTVNALGESIQANYFLFKEKKTAWIELSQASGLDLIPKEKRDPLIASTYGTGILIKNALERGCNEIILGIGGSATTDGGAGIFEALGGLLIDKNGNHLEKGGVSLKKLYKIIPPKISRKITWKVACDVTNPILGKNGAVNVYSPQKGASEKDIVILNESLTNFVKIIEKNFKRKISNLVGGGAAGGTAAGLNGFFGATLDSGFFILSDLIGLEKEIKDFDLIFTAEGKIDHQSIEGKLTGNIAKIGKKYSIPVIGLTGRLVGDYDELYKSGFSGVFSIQKGPMDLSESLSYSSELLTDITSRVLTFYKGFAN